MEQIQTAIEWALQQSITLNEGTVGAESFAVTKNTHRFLVDKVREYFNIKGIPYNTFSYEDLVPYLGGIASVEAKPIITPAIEVELENLLLAEMGV
ncbi:MAG: hypothetical protein WC749_02435 [Dehalococcoidia bacterium]